MRRESFRIGRQDWAVKQGNVFVIFRQQLLQQFELYDGKPFSIEAQSAGHW